MAGASTVDGTEYWLINERESPETLKALRELLGREPTRDEARAVEQAVRNYQHVWKRIEGGADLDEARKQLKRFERALAVVAAFLDQDCDDPDPSPEHQQREAAFLLMAHSGVTAGTPPESWPQLRDLAQSCLKAARAAQDAKIPTVRDPGASTLFISLADAIERLGGAVTVRGHQGGAGEHLEPWSPFVKFMYAAHTSVARHVHRIPPGKNDPRLPMQNSGYPKAISDALAQREVKRLENEP